MSKIFIPATREDVWLLLGLAGGTGSGKTYTAMRLAAGISGDKPFAVIDTEARRALHYADQFKFDHADLVAPFSPQRYGDAVMAAADAGYKVIVIDSTSHEHEGDGGLLDMQEQELQRMAGDNHAKRETCLQASWIKPKREHKRLFVQKVLQVRAHIIFCMRAEDKTELKKIDGKLKMVPKASLTGLDGWIPICEKRFPFELTASFLLTADAPGIPKPIKLQEQHRALFPLDKPITEESGQRLAAWAKGSQATPATTSAPRAPDSDKGALSSSPGPAGAGLITVDQTVELEDALKENKKSKEKLLANVSRLYGSKIERLAQIRAADYNDAIAYARGE